MRVSAPALIATHLGAVAVGWAVTDKRPVDEEVKHTGFFQIDTTKVLATTVESSPISRRTSLGSWGTDP